VREWDAARYLYRYRGDLLADAMDTEIRPRIQTDVSDNAACYDFEYLRLKKAEIMEWLRLVLCQSLIVGFQES